MTRWERTISAGTLLEVSFENARADPPQALVLEVDRGRLAWDEQGEEGRALRVWADRHDAVVLRLTRVPGRFGRATLTVWNAYLDHDEIDGEIVREAGPMRVAEQPGGVTLSCRDGLVARIEVHARTGHRERTSSE